MTTLDDLESRLQSLLEVNFVKYLPGYRTEDQVAQQLAMALHGSLVERGGEMRAPNLYVIIAHPTTLADWTTSPDLLKELGDAIQAVGDESGLKFTSRPHVSTSADASMAPGQIRISASYTTEPLVETRGIPLETKDKTETGDVPSNAFLIIGGTKVIQLNRSVLNLGRRLDNHIVIDDPRVSRSHAQLRSMNGRFVIFDLDSTGGTFVNGERVRQSVLYPGDVISLAGASLIFGQDLPDSHAPESDQTRPDPSLRAERPTAVLKKEDKLR
jgi:hypothetical protein